MTDDGDRDKIGDERSSEGLEPENLAQPNSVPTADEKPSSWLYKIYRLATCTPLLLLAILLVLEIWLRQGSNPICAMNVRTVDDRDAAGGLLLSRRVSPQAVLIGSSLILAINQDEGGGHYLWGHDPNYLNGLLDRATGQKIICLNLGTGGQMASESYFMAEAVCNAPDYPRVIIYGVSLRDFAYAKTAQEWRTESFNSIAPFAPISAVRNIYSHQALQEFFLCHYFYLYRDREDFKNLFSALVKDALEILPLNQSFVRLGADLYWRPQKQGYLTECWTPARQGKLIEKMRAEYPKRLKDYFKSLQTMDFGLAQVQTVELSYHYFKCLQKLCQRKHVLLVVVNMPLSPDTAAVVPAEPMQDFRDFLHKDEHDDGYALIDLWADSHFADSDYNDGVHFNLGGSRKFCDLLVQQLQAKFPAVLDRLSSQTRGKER